MKEIAKNYNAQEFEQDIYKQWEESGMFNPDNLNVGKKYFSVALPPPNATGVLHLGHAAMLAY
ncbi:class I tRNA ligase family protein, partial [Patescibacteria group bacterium]|nr:class I tRNA ligase family protein [Patescibacteria group bacterium]